MRHVMSHNMTAPVEFATRYTTPETVAEIDSGIGVLNTTVCYHSRKRSVGHSNLTR